MRPLVLALLLAGCTDSMAEPCPRVGLTRSPPGRPGVDLLIVVDDTVSMSEEQASLAAALPRLMQVLATGDLDGDGDGHGDGELDDPDFEPVDRLHVGVVTTDMGTGGHAVPTCADRDFGDDGVLRTSSPAAGCEATYPPFLQYPASDGDPAALAADAGCLVRAGTDGCGFERPLEAALKALSPAAPTAWTAPAYEPPRFFENTYGHGDRANDGFQHHDSILAVVLLTDDDDCSAADPALYDTAGPYDSDLNFRCVSHPDAMTPVERYVEGLLQLRREPERVVFLPIVGIPLGTGTAGGSTDWDAILAHPDMAIRPNPDMPAFQAAACDGAPNRHAKPAVRIVEVASALERSGARASVASICEADYAGALDELARQLRAALTGADCLPRPIAVELDGSTDCELYVTGPSGAGCDALEGATPVEDGDRSVCRLPQLVPASRSPGSPPPEGVGWFYDDFSADSRCRHDHGGGGIVVRPELPSGWTLRLECHPGALETPCVDDDDCGDLPGATCAGGVCAGWTCR